MPPNVTFGFTKLVVKDLAAMATFYRAVYGLHPVDRICGERIGDEEIDEIVLSADPNTTWSPTATSSWLVLLKYVDRSPPSNGEVILGFMTDDLPALLERVRASGGDVYSPIEEMPEQGLRVAFATDPEGHLAEVIQLLL
jgi:predicted enzyme related to lactoylglutathione lyase